jgi:acyl-CoA dehydrogenase
MNLRWPVGSRPWGLAFEGGDTIAVENELHSSLRQEVRRLCLRFPDEYWQRMDAERKYPEEFVQAMSDAAFLSVLIPEEYGGLGLGVIEASIILEEIHRSGGNAAACHAQMYIMGTLLRHGSEEQKARYLPDIASGSIRLQAFGVTEPNTGSDTTKLRTRAVRDGDRYIVTGQKVFISRVLQSDLMLLLARTTPLEEVLRKSEGLSVFLVDLRDVPPEQLTVQPIETMMTHHTNAVYFDGLEIPAKNLIGEENRGFRYILDSMNAERTLIAAECIGDADWFIDKSTKYAGERVIFDRPIGQNQGIAFPIARAYANTRAADLMRYRAAELFDTGEPCGAESNMAKLLAADASWESANVAMQTHGGYGFTREFSIERKFRETRLYQVAPVSTNLILSYLAQHVLGLPRSF